MSKTSLILLSGATLLCLAVLARGPLKSVLAHPQEPDLPATSSRNTPARNAHDALGLGPVPDAAAAKLGEPLYQQNCAACHGTNARGGVGPNLVRSVLVLHDVKAADLTPFVKAGRGNMPAFPNLTDTQIYNIAEFIHLQVELAANRGLYTHADTLTTGDAAKGKAFFSTNCASCHSAMGDLRGIGTKYPQPAAMLTRFAWPAKRGPRQATVTTPSGEKLTGTLTHYDDFETTLKTSTGSTTTWPTPDVKVDIPDKLAGHRALLPKYSDDDLHDLTRYLLTLK